MATDKVIFFSDRDVNQGLHNELYVVDANGENLVKLTTNFDAPYPDPDGITEILLRGPDGIDKILEFPFRMIGDVPVWSRDGARIAFASDRHGDQNIYVMTSAWTDLIRLTREPTRDWNPAWSPTGERIAFLSLRNGDPHLYVMNADGEELVRISAVPVRDGEPCWSPGGQKLCWVGVSGERSDLFVHDLAASASVKITSVAGQCGHPSWSPDGHSIAFASDQSGRQEIYILQLADGRVDQLTGTAESGSFHPLWSSDGKQILFRSDRLGNEEIFIMNADGSGQRPITQNPRVKYNAGRARWLPGDSPSVDLLQKPEGQLRDGVLLPDGRVPDWPAKFAITFKNARGQSVDVFWLSSEISARHQTLLAPGASEAFWTFQGHRFRFRDHETGFVIRADAIADPNGETVIIE